MYKRKYEEMKYNNDIRYYKDKIVYYFKNEQEELKYFNYKNVIIEKDKIIPKHKNEKELKDNINYVLGLVPKNALFFYQDKYYKFLKYDNHYQIVFVQEYDIDKNKYKSKYIFKPNIIIKRIFV